MQLLFRVALASLPVLFGLLYFFAATERSLPIVRSFGLWQALLGFAGLGAICLLWFGPRLLRDLREARQAPAPRRADAPGPDDDSGFDADAVIARYLPARPTAAASHSAPAPHPDTRAARNSLG